MRSHANVRLHCLSGVMAEHDHDHDQVDRVSTLWTSLIVPLLNMQMSGWVWYQGENNVGGSTTGGAGCCAIGCPSTWKGTNACHDRCNASAALCADYYACQFPASKHIIAKPLAAGAGAGGAGGRDAGVSTRTHIPVQCVPQLRNR